MVVFYTSVRSWPDSKIIFHMKEMKRISLEIINSFSMALVIHKKRKKKLIIHILTGVLIIIIIMDTYITPVSAKFDAHGCYFFRCFINKCKCSL